MKKETSGIFFFSFTPEQDRTNGERCKIDLYLSIIPSHNWPVKDETIADVYYWHLSQLCGCIIV